MRAGLAGSVELLALSVWLGAALVVAAVVAPAAFAVLPSRALAGALVGRVLPVVFISGVVVALISVVCEVVAARGQWSLWRGGIPLLLLAVGCAAAQFVVSPKIERIRSSVSGPIDSLDASDARRVTFGKLHALSVAFLGLAMIGATISVGTRLYSAHSYDSIDSH